MTPEGFVKLDRNTMPIKLLGEQTVKCSSVSKQQRHCLYIGTNNQYFKLSLVLELGRNKIIVSGVPGGKKSFLTK